MSNPIIIQGGMGVGVSHWPLARAVSLQGQLGVVSGTALDLTMARHLQLGDPEGHLRRALAAFPIPGIARRILDAYFIPEGKDPGKPFKPVPMASADSPRALVELIMAANFAEVFLAREGHNGLVGINYLQKIQFPTLPALYGALLAGVDYVLMGAGIPMAIPGIIDRLSRGESARLRIDVEGLQPGEEFHTALNPEELWGAPAPSLKRPKFVAIISSTVLALTLAQKASGRVDGFVVEGPLAGGHNAPPRGVLQLNERGEPVYGPRDQPDLAKIRALGLPFWLAGSEATPERLAEALQKGAAGIQVGTAFAFCEESGIEPNLKSSALDASRGHHLDVFTDPLASPTGYPFKVLRLEGTASEPGVIADRRRLCDLGYLRRAYRKPNGQLGYRCPGEPVEQFVAKGGDISETVGRKCVCNGLTATVGLGFREPALVTAGEDALHLERFLSPGKDSYSAADVLAFLLREMPVVDPKN